MVGDRKCTKYVRISNKARGPVMNSNCNLLSTQTLAENMAEKKEYGAWKSPISSRLATQSSVGFQELHTGSDGKN